MARPRRIDRRMKERRERKYRLRGGKGRTTRFIPDADREFAQMARWFANHVERNAERFDVEPGTVEELTSAVARYRDALSRALHRDTAGPRATRIKNEARKEAERMVRKVAKFLRGTMEESLTAVDRYTLNLPKRSKRGAKRLTCPQIAPILKFIGSTDPHGYAAGGGKHILEYRNDFDHASAAKPHGAKRLELFVDLVPVDEPIPSHPGERSGGRLWYLRSFTTSRFEVDFPRLFDGDRPVPMRVVYWGRWADSTGNVGPFSKTCVAPVENDLRQCLPGGPARGSQLSGAPRGDEVCVMQITQVRGRIEAKPNDVRVREREPLTLPGG